jgi:hypothetical protein
MQTPLINRWTRLMEVAKTELRKFNLAQLRWRNPTDAGENTNGRVTACSAWGQRIWLPIETGRTQYNTQRNLLVKIRARLRLGFERAGPHRSSVRCDDLESAGKSSREMNLIGLNFKLVQSPPWPGPAPAFSWRLPSPTPLRVFHSLAHSTAPTNRRAGGPGALQRPRNTIWGSVLTGDTGWRTPRRWSGKSVPAPS